MKYRLFTGMLALSFFLSSQPAVQGALPSGPQQGQGRGGGGGGGGRGQAQPQPQGRRAGGPAEPAVRQALAQRIQRELQLPDSQLTRLTALTFLYRDSVLMLEGREEFIRRELRREGEGDNNRRPNEDRISCLIGALWDVQRSRVNTRFAEDREIASFLTPSKRLKYLAIQDNFHVLIDQLRDRRDNRDGRDEGASGGRPGGGGRGPGQAGPPGAPPGGGRGGPAFAGRGPLPCPPPGRGR